MRRRLDQLVETNRRYGHPFALAVFDASGPGTRNGDAGGGQETVLAIVGAALRDSIRIVDEAFRLEEDAICVLAPNLRTVEGGADGGAAARPARRAGAGGGAADRGLGRGRRLPRARRRRRGCCTRPTRRCGARTRSGSRWASAPCKIADRFRKFVHNCVNPRMRCANEYPQMPGIRTNAAAEVLGVSPNTLRSWERRYGYPVPKRTVGNHRNYELMELQTLRDALAQTGNISSAIELARQRQSAPASGGEMLAALESFDEAAADRAIEESLALRPLERTVEELLLPAIDELAADPDREAELEFAARWATGWLHGARRLASAASRPAGILLLDSSRGQDAEEVHTQALDLALRRAGFRVLVLSNELGDERLERALGASPDRDRALRPRRRDPGRGQAGPQDPRARLRRPALRLPRRRPDRRRGPLRRREAQPGHGHAQRRPAPPRRPGFRLGGLTGAYRCPRSLVCRAHGAPCVLDLLGQVGSAGRI